MKRLAIAAVLLGCGTTDETVPDAYVPANPGQLGMNDVTMLLPLPASKAMPTLLAMTDGGDLVPRTLFDRLVVQPGDVFGEYETFHLVAVRFDLCDRTAAGVCPSGDGRLRLVFQPLFEAVPSLSAADIGLHAFYPIPAAELPRVIDELRGLAAIGNTDRAAPLAVAPAMNVPRYVTTLRALVLRYAAAAKLTRLTLFAQNAMAASFIWVFRGIELRAGLFIDIPIPDVSVKEQTVRLGGADTYEVTPVADAPVGISLGFDNARFIAASAADRREALGALAEALDPRKHGGDTEQCVGCHVSTFLLENRAGIAGIDPTTLAERYTSTYDLSIAAGMSATNELSLRNLGWRFDEPAISQRVANDTAQVLTEIEQRFPAP